MLLDGYTDYLWENVLKMNSEAKSYKETVNLPQTEFNMRANAVQREPELQQLGPAAV